ncbi:hypothetical protein L2E82_50786 [Cichorium intybus]|nr:hypothetical protein L2E82_50786 [Cichorium intybus]
MEKSAPVGNIVLVFVSWEEVSSTNHEGRREVRYYLKRRDGTSDLAVVSKEKKPGYNTKTSSSSSFHYRYAIRDKSLSPSSDIPFEISSKLKSRRQTPLPSKTLKTRLPPQVVPLQPFSVFSFLRA